MDDTKELVERPEYQPVMERLERAKKVSATGIDYWHAREIGPILGYHDWEKFEPVIGRAMEACDGVGISPPHHFRRTAVMMELGNGGRRQGEDFFLTRAACYLVAMNGNPSKAEVAAAQAYFTRQTRKMEQTDQFNQDQRRLEMRERVSSSFRKVSGIAQDAGVKNQGYFHDARYQGLYRMSYREVKQRKGIKDKEILFDRASALELSMNDFQMNLAAEVISKDKISGEPAAIKVNRQIGERVRATVKDSGGRMPEDLPLEPPIAEVKKRIKAASRKRVIKE
jgi:DNA-damage-inducible protein D